MLSKEHTKRPGTVPVLLTWRGLELIAIQVVPLL